MYSGVGKSIGERCNSDSLYNLSQIPRKGSSSI